MSPRAFERPSRGPIAAVVVALAVGAVLRGWQLGPQAVVFDEWHTLGAAAGLGYREILGSFGEHSSIPLSLYLRWCLETVGVDLVTFRGPFFLAGLATVAAPWLLWRGLVGRGAAALAALSYAISPLLIYHSRFARPYAIALPLALLAVTLGAAWWRERRPALAVGYAVAAASTGFFTLAYLPFVLAPFATAVASLALERERRSRRDGTAWLLVAALTGLLLALLIGPAWWGDRGTITGKLGTTTPALDLLAVLRFASGSMSLLVGLAASGLVVAGVIALARKRPRSLPVLLVPAAVQVLAVMALQPRAIDNPPVVARYVLPAIAIALVLAAVGVLAAGAGAGRLLVRAARAPVRIQTITAAVAAAWIGVLLVSGPLGVFQHWPSAWLNELMAMRLLNPAVEPTRLLRRLPAFYRELQRHAPGSLVIVEAPYTGLGLYAPYPWYQLGHRQHTWVAAETTACEVTNSKQLPRHPGLRLPGLFFLADLDALVASGADYLVVHGQPAREVTYFRDGSWHAKNLRMAGAGCIAWVESRLGAPIAREEGLAVFALRPQPGSQPGGL